MKEALETKRDVSAMRLLEKCQEIASKLGDGVEAIKGKDYEEIAILDDYCELVYEINEQVWHGEYINPGKVYRYLNKCLINLKSTREY